MRAFSSYALRGHWLLAIACLAWVLTSRAAFAHPIPPVTISVLETGTLVTGESSPAFVNTSFGLARAAGDGSFHYICPSRWDGNSRALAYRSGETLLVLSFGVAYLSFDAGCTFAALDLGEPVVSAHIVEGRFALLVGTRASRRILLVDEQGDTQALTLDFPARPDGLLGQSNALWVTGAGPPAFVARVAGASSENIFVAEEGTEMNWGARVIPVAADSAGVWLELSGGTLALARVESAGLVDSRDFTLSRRGPVNLDGRTLAMFDQVLHEWDGAGWTASSERSWDCLQQYGERVFACSGSSTLELVSSAAGEEERPYFSMLQIGAPESCGDDGADLVCENEWLHYSGESGWAETDPALDPVSPRREPTCSAGGHFSGSSLAPLFFALIALRRRSR